MKPKATIYKSGKSGKHGELILELPRLLKAAYHFLRILGVTLILASIAYIVFLVLPTFGAEMNYFINNSRRDKTPVDYTKHVVDSNYTLAIQKEAESFGVGTYFSVVIPKIGAYSDVIANVDASNSDEYLEALSKGVAHAKGTSLPGKSGRIFIFSHSTDSPLNFARYNAVFYLLKKLEDGDQIIVYFADRRYVYEVTEQKIISPIDTTWLMPKEGEEELVLMTCDPPGTTWNRLLVIAKPVEK